MLFVSVCQRIRVCGGITRYRHSIDVTYTLLCGDSCRMGERRRLVDGHRLEGTGHVPLHMRSAAFVNINGESWLTSQKKGRGPWFLSKRGITSLNGWFSYPSGFPSFLAQEQKRA